MTLIIYHSPCPDGMAAAWVFANHYKKTDEKEKLEFHGADHGHVPPLDKAKDQTVILVDYCYNAQGMAALVEVAAMIIVLDHHASTQKLEPLFPTIRFVLSNDMSGCQLAWIFCYQPETAMPWWLNHVADRDLFRWAIPTSKATTRALDALYAFDNIQRLNLVTGLHDQSELEWMGRVLLSGDRIRYEGLAQAAQSRTLVCPDGQRFKAAYVFCDAKDASEVGDLLCKQMDADGHAIYQLAVLPRYDPLSDCFRVSLRAIGDLNLVPIASQFRQGGGHARAAGFVCPTREALEAVLEKPV